MPADNTVHLVTAARQRHELTRAKAIRALRELDQAGTPVTFEIVAKQANVSRSWLYTQPDIRAEIERQRQSSRHTPSTPIPGAQRASNASLQQRLNAANERCRLLTEQNQQLRSHIAELLGELRATRQHRSSITIEPR
jgi:DNA anti-recombination protein RmuC